MSNFIQLVKNEQMKTYSQVATWIMYIVLAVFIIGFGVFMKIDQSMTDGNQAAGDDWKQELQAENEQLQKQMEEQEFAAPYNEQTMAMNEYRIENDIKPGGYDVWDFVQDNRTNISIISLLTIIVAAGMIANEFKWGSIKLLLIRPISRTKILASKYVSVLIFAITMLLFLYVLSFLVGSVLFGFESLTAPYLYWQSEEVHQAPIFQLTISQYGLSSVNLLMMATFAFMVSAIFRNSSLAIGVAIFLMMSGNAIVGFFSGKEWAKFILFANTNLNQFFTGTPVISDLTLGFSVTVLIVYLILFLGLSWFFFSKRDVTNA
ncbi:ABC transporter permease [Halobacillus shinanisalinarum]|uniref:ABC transporter permease n=1 Tax=Halobacillus shinanisalinarum TaxID=2932258 RepID=A0ABY4GUG0_9BACI|nr:ABC transporter permease [Halobacillus shinanisalinarum]UOQ91659.1 ABC transporter permease [Halobacillus shinanisalinarum]